MSERERAEERATKGPHAPGQRAREQHEKARQDFKVRWTRLYLDYTAKYPRLAALHADAQRYLDELEGASTAWHVMPHPPVPTNPAERTILEKSI